MKRQSTITINDILYDAKLGRPLGKSPVKTKSMVQPKKIINSNGPIRKRTAYSISRDIQKSTTLNRRTALHLHTQQKNTGKSDVPTIHNISTPTKRSDGELLLKKKPLHFDITKPTPKKTTIATHNQGNSLLRQLHNDTQPTSHKPHAVQPKLENLISSSLRNAKSHLEEPLRDIKKSKKKMSTLRKTAAVTASIFLLTGFFAYQNITLLSVSYAAKKSGVHASVPDYTPSGFSPSRKISYQPGKVTVSFFSHSDSRQFDLDQQNSSWDSEEFALVVNNISKGAYHIREMSGKTIYLYNDSDATWIENGVWYTIHGDSKLTSEQLISIATSV